jgi:hypothetical protein
LLTRLATVSCCTAFCFFLQRSAKLPKNVCPFDVARHANDYLLTQLMQSSVSDWNSAVCWWGIHAYRLIARLIARSLFTHIPVVASLVLALGRSHVWIPVRRLGILTEAMQISSTVLPGECWEKMQSKTRPLLPSPPFFPWRDSP